MDDWFKSLGGSDDDDDDGDDVVDLTLSERMSRRMQQKNVAVRSPKRKRDRRFWTDDEIESLKAGVERYGVYRNCWAKIIEDEDFEFHACRTSVDLKDKYRNLQLPERQVTGGWLNGLIKSDKKKKKKRKKKHPRLIIVGDPSSPSTPTPSVSTPPVEKSIIIPNSTTTTTTTLTKKQQKQLERENKKLLTKLKKIADKRRTGQFSMEQIRVVFEESFSKTTQAFSLVQALVNRITSNDAETDSESKAVKRMSDDVIETCKRSLKGAIWWEQRVELQPEEIDALKRNIVTESELLKTQSVNPGERNVVVWMSAEECCKLLFVSPRGSNEMFIRDVMTRQSLIRMGRERLVILLHGIESHVREIHKSIRNRTTTATYIRNPSVNAVENAVMQLYIRSGIDVKMCDTYDECARYLLETTIVTARGMAPSSVTGRFSGIKKSKSTLDPSSDHKAYNTADVWLRHLECIPGLSHKKARTIAVRFPTLTSLLSHYASLNTDQERENALEQIINPGRRERTLSARVFKVFTSSNPDMIL